MVVALLLYTLSNFKISCDVIALFVASDRKMRMQ